MKPAYLRCMIQLALAEDLGQGDITTEGLVPSKSLSRARLIAKSEGIICGINIARDVFRALDTRVKFRARLKDGQPVRKDDIIAEIWGPTRALLSAERVALNFLTILSGIATKTSLLVKKIKPYKAKILDTRKTTPLWRQLERYAVRMGGGENHRFNLNDMVLIKDNHLVFCAKKPIGQVVSDFKKRSKAKVELEVDSLLQLKEAFASSADIILLDNMTPGQIVQAVKMRRKFKSRVLLEASGGINLDNVRQYAAAGVDRISIGSLTHSPVLDISMELVQNP